MQPHTLEDVNSYLTKLGLILDRPREDEFGEDEWVVYDQNNEVWSGPFNRIPDFTAWFFEHAAYTLNQVEKVRRFTDAFAAADGPGRDLLVANFRSYRSGRDPQPLYAMFEGIDLSSDKLPPDWAEQLVDCFASTRGTVDFARQVMDYLDEVEIP